jgi:hypothetical protein
MNKLRSVIVVLVVLTVALLAGSPLFAQPPRAKVLLIDKMTGWDGQQYLQLMEIAAGLDIDLILSTGYTANPKILESGYNGIIVFGGGGGENNNSRGETTAEQLVDLQIFTKRGGRIAFFALPKIRDFNDELRNLFKISAGSELMTTPKKKVYSTQGRALTPLWDGLEVGSKKSYDADLGLWTYFASLNVGQEYTTIANQEGETRKVSIHDKLGDGEYLFISSFSTGGGGIPFRNIGNILHDRNISAWDNEKAAERLLLWLVGNRSYADGGQQNVPADGCAVGEPEASNNTEQI